MKNPWLVYVTVAVISALAGVAIAGPPNTVGTDATIVVPDSTTSTTTSTTTTSVPAPDPEPAPTTTEAPDQTTTTTDAAQTTTSTTTTTEPAPEVDRASVVVVAVNGASVGGVAARVRDELRDLGFEGARSADGTTIVEDTVVYFLPGFEAEAVDVTGALGLEFEAIKPIIEAPSFEPDAGDQVAVYIGRDRA